MLFKGHLPHKHTVFHRLFSWEALKELIEILVCLCYISHKPPHSSSTFYDLNEIFRSLGHQ